MKATRNGWTIDGTPEEILTIVQLSAQGDTSTKPTCKATTTPAIIETADKTPAKRIDWPKAEALKKAGWSIKAIAAEIGSTYATVYAHFKDDKGDALND